MVRPLVWSPALLALVVVLLLALFESDRFALWVEKFAEDQAGNYLDREVEIGSLTIDLIPLSVEARDVVIGGPGSTEAGDGKAGLPFAEVESVRVQARIGNWIRPGITLHRVFVAKPLIRVGFDEEGQHDAPRRKRRRSPDLPKRFEVAIGALEVVDGQLETEHRKYSLEIFARDFRANLNGGDTGLELAGQLRANEVTLVLPQARPYLGSVSVFGSYRPGRVEIALGTFAAPDLNAEATGFLQWRGERRTHFSIEASGHGRLVDRIGYGRGLVSGPFDFDGEFDRGEREWSLAGGLSSPGVRVIDRRLNSVRGRLVVDNGGARYRIENAGYGNGTIEGSVRMGLGSGDAPVELDLQLAGVDVERLLEDQRIPISGLAATASGNFSYQFARSEPRSGSGWADLSVAQRPEGGLPVDGSAVLSIEGGRLQTEAVRLTSTDQLIVAKGTYDMASSAGRFDVEVTSEVIEEVLDLLPIADREAVWLPHGGRGEVLAELTLDGDAVQVLTEVSLQNVSAPGYEADRVQGRFLLDAVGVRDLRVELLRPAAGLIVTGSVPLAPLAPDAAEGLSIAVDAEGWPVSELEPWLPFELPLRGPFSGGITVEGSPEAPRGSARGRVGSPSLGEFEASRFNFDLEFSPEEVRFHEAEVGYGGGAIRARGSYDLLADRLALEIDSDRIELSAIELLPAPERLGGTAEVSGRLGGSSTEPDLGLVLSIEGASRDGVLLGDNGSGEFRLEWHGEDLRSEGGVEGLVTLDGGGVLKQGVADLTFDVASADLATILGLLMPEEALPEFEASGHGQLNVAGAVTGDQLPAIRLGLDRLLVRPPGEGSVALENLAPVLLGLDGNALDVNSLYLAAPDGESEFIVAGRIELGGDKILDLNVQSSLAASWLEPWTPAGIDLAEGSFEVIGSVVGTASAPSMDGIGRFSEGKVVSSGFAATFESTEAVFLFYPGQAVLDELSARVAGGRLDGAGTVSWEEPGTFDYRFQVSGERLSFRYPEGWSIRGDTEFTLSSIPGGRQLTGALDLDRALYVTDVPIELDQLLRAFFEQRRVEVETTDALLTTTQLNLAVSADQTMRIRNNLADLRGTADLVLRGNLGRPVVFGTVEFDPSGRLIYSGNEYELERGLLTFANPYRLEPVIDLVAHTGLREYDVTLSLSGTPEQLNFDFISDPPLAELEVMALMTGGQPRDPEFGQTRESQSLQGENLGAESFLAGQATSLLANRFNRLFGLDQFRIVPLTSSTGDLSAARVTVGKQLSRDLFATYSYDPSETEEQILELEWSVSRSLVLVLTQNGDGSYAVDAKWEKAF